jgi:hypothetical protein
MDLHVLGCKIELDSSYNMVVTNETENTLSVSFDSNEHGMLTIRRYDGFIPSTTSRVNVEHHKLKDLDVYDITRMVSKHPDSKRMVQITDGKEKIGLVGPIADDWRNIFKDCLE